MGNSWGDWLNVNENTPIEYIDLCYHAQSARLMAAMAPDDAQAQPYRDRFAILQRNWARQFLNPGGELAVDTQTACVLALAFDLANGAGGNQNASMNSFSHYSFGAVMEWAFRSLAGIDTHGPDYKHIVIRPNPPSPGGNSQQKPIDWVNAHYDSIHGRIVSNWRRTATRFELETTIPPNTSATVYLPARDAGTISESGKPLRESSLVKWVRTTPDRVVLALEPGAYRFASAVP